MGGVFVPAAQYLRESTRHQHYSIVHQTHAIRTFAQLHGFEVVKTYSDAARSGITLKKRPALMQLLADVVRGDAGFAAILVYDVSRWGRFQDCDESAHYEFVCKSAGAPVHYCAEHFLNENNLATSVLKALKRSIAAEYSRELGVRIYSGERHGAELGFKQGGKAGYGLQRLMVSADGRPKGVLSIGGLKNLRTDRVVLTPGPANEVACIREMFRLVFEERLTPRDIALELNRRGETCPTGKWTKQFVHRILTNPNYAGSCVWNRSSCRLGSKKIKVPKSQWVFKANAFEPVVDRKQFEKVQRILSRDEDGKTNQELLDILRDLMKRKGRLSPQILQGEQDLPSVHAFITAFGSLRRAFELVGQTYKEQMPTDHERYRAKVARAELISQLLARFPHEVSIISSNIGGPDYIRVDNATTVAIVVCPATQRYGRTEWFADSALTNHTPITLLGRLGRGNASLNDCYVMRTPKYRWMRGAPHYGTRLGDISEFYTAVHEMSAALHGGSEKPRL